MRHISLPTRGAATALTALTLVLGYVLLGIVPAILFAFGFLGGLVLWLVVPSRPDFQVVKAPFGLALSLFVVHKVEERQFDFFPALSQLTGVRMPDANSVLVYLLYTAAAAWLAIPFLVGRRHEFGYYLAWTFFTSMGVIELAHFVFPLFVEGPYRYFPGMASVVVLAPSAWWGLLRLCSSQSSDAR